MTGRERLNAVLRREPTDRIPWSTLVDETTLSRCPEELRGNDGLDFYRHLGCDIFMLDGFNTPHTLRTPELVWGDGVLVNVRREGTRTIRETTTPMGTLTAVFEQGHPVKYPVDSLDTIRIYQSMWENAAHVEHDDWESLAAIDALIGDQGVATRFWGPTPIPQLLQLDMGIESFYTLWYDHPDAVESLIHIMHERKREAFRQLARGPWDSVTLCENTSTSYISPDLYRKHNMPHQREFVELAKGCGKTAIIHMCGLVRGVLDLVKETGCDGIHFLTPPPTGDTPWEEALDVIGEDLIILGCLDPTVFASGPVDGIGSALDRLITPRLREANFVLHPTADGIAVELERFYAVKRWVERNGAA
jgi:Uroporphyrinogen decarboxylase (URO-D)